MVSEAFCKILRFFKGVLEHLSGISGDMRTQEVYGALQGASRAF